MRKLCLLAAALFLALKAPAQGYELSVEASLGIINGMGGDGDITSKVAASAGATIETVRDAGDLIISNVNQEILKVGYGQTGRRRGKCPEPGHARPGEGGSEIVTIYKFRFQAKYDHLIEKGLSPEDAQRALDWYLAAVLVHEARHVNQGKKIPMPPGAEWVNPREVDAYVDELLFVFKALDDETDPDVLCALEEWREEACGKIDEALGTPSGN